MSDYNKDFQQGYYGTGTGTHAHQAGAEQRAAEEARSRGPGGGGGGPGGGGDNGGGMGAVLLLGLVAVGALVVLLLDYLIAMAAAIVILAAIFRLVLPTAGPRPGWPLALGSAAVAYLIILAACVVVVGAAQLFGGGEDVIWMPAVQKLYLDEGAGHYVVHSGLQSFLIPWSLGLAGAVWWLNRKLPPLRFGGAGRIALFAGLPTIVYIAALNLLAVLWP